MKSKKTYKKIKIFASFSPPAPGFSIRRELTKKHNLCFEILLEVLVVRKRHCTSNSTPGVLCTEYLDTLQEAYLGVCEKSMTELFPKRIDGYFPKASSSEIFDRVLNTLLLVTLLSRLRVQSQYIS